VTIAAVPTANLNGGEGTADVLVVNDAAGFKANTKVTGFEVLALGALSAKDNDATGFTALLVGGAIGGDASFTNVAAGTALSITGATGKAVTYTLKDAVGTTDAMTLNIGSATTKGIDAGTVVTTGVELQTVNSVGTGKATDAANKVVITNDKATSLVVVGNHTAEISGFKAVTTIDLSKATGLVDVSKVTVADAGVTATAGTGGSKITGGIGKDTLTGGAGADALNGGAGADVIVGNGGKDVITGGAGADDITISGGMNKLVFALADSGANKTTNTQTTALTTGFDVIKGAMAGDTIEFVGATFGFGDVIAKGNNLAGVDNDVVFVRGSFDAAAGIFSYAANGADTLMTADTDSVVTLDGIVGVAFESVVLIGFVAGANTSAAGGLITLA
jgi:S-layer protein